MVKAANRIGFNLLLPLARPSGAPDRSALRIAVDDTAAKAETARLLDILGYDVVDIGALAESWRSEPNTPVQVAVVVLARGARANLALQGEHALVLAAGVHVTENGFTDVRGARYARP
ncbi:hypothetical protein [Streptomyces sp. KM273126]|uniref:hypothetical protein n=1 Tax=Streptomyces sp. KM273126 TaxID=2545247 RepID=UPI002689F562|nr:hypothetical protein [Streptomyces sp. KM273126]